MSSAIETSIGSRASSLSNACAARTSRSTCSLSSWKRLSNVARRLSASTNEPTTNDTLAVIANRMASVRPQRARMLLRAMRVPALMFSPSSGDGRSPGRRVGSTISPVIFPSPTNTTRSAYDAATGSWVTITMVWPNSRTASRMNVRISVPVTESRLPVGSSAKMICGRDASARATATRCCWPPDSSLGRCLRRSPRPTVATTWSIHSLSPDSPPSIIGSRMFSSAVSVGIRLNAWKTKPTLVRRSSVSSLSSSAAR